MGRADSGGTCLADSDDSSGLGHDPQRTLPRQTSLKGQEVAPPTSDRHAEVAGLRGSGHEGVGAIEAIRGDDDGASR